MNIATNKTGHKPLAISSTTSPPIKPPMRPKEENETIDIKPNKTQNSTNSHNLAIEDEFLKNKQKLSTTMDSLSVYSTVNDNDYIDSTTSYVPTDFNGNITADDDGLTLTTTITDENTTVISTTLELGDNWNTDNELISTSSTQTTEDPSNPSTHFELPFDETSTKSFYEVIVTLETSTTSLPTTTNTMKSTVNTTDVNMDYSLTGSSAPFSTTNGPIPETTIRTEINDARSHIIKLAAISTCICFVVIISLYVFIKKRRRGSSMFPMKCRPITLSTFHMGGSMVNSFRMKKRRRSTRSYGNQAFEEILTPSRRLNANELATFARNPVSLNAEFDDIPNINVNYGEIPEECAEKNRYANVIPIPETRVILRTVKQKNDFRAYINANYIPGYGNQENYYIACQAPMDHTISDFWRMTWENNAKVIIMLTNIFENNVKKCANYLPSSVVTDYDMTFDEFQITLQKREIDSKTVISHLQIKNLDNNTTKEVTHIAFAGWPNQGVPSEACPIISMLIQANAILNRKVSTDSTITNNNHRDQTSVATVIPKSSIIVHCSPGTGRTGTVIAIDMAIHEYELTNTIDIPKHVAYIRRSRARAVETREQYAFIYKAVNFYVNKFRKNSSESV